MKNEKVNRLPHWCITDLQPAFYDTDSLTAVEQTGRVYAKVSELITSYNEFVDSINKHIEEFENGINKSIEVFEIELRQEFQDFIDIIDLKLQDIDSDLQDAVSYMKTNVSESVAAIINGMKNNGELDDVILGTFNNIDGRVSNLEDKSAIHTNNINSMKLLELKNGDVVKTLGFYTPNDGGGAVYLIREKTYNDIEDNGSIHFINESLVAEILINGEINVNQFGAYGDGMNDDTLSIQNAIDYASNSYYQPIVKLLNKVYSISNIELKTKTKLIGCGVEDTKLLIEDGATGSAISLIENSYHYCYLSDLTIACRSNNNNIENAIEIRVEDAQFDSFSTFENLRIHYIPNGNGIWNAKGGRECRFNNIIIRECGNYGLISGSSDSFYYNITSSWCGKSGVWNTGSNNRYVNCKAYCNGGKGATRHDLAGFYLTGGMSTFTSCDAQENYGDGFFISQSHQSLINCKGDANGQKSIVNGVNPTDNELTYCGFYVSTEYTGSIIKYCNLIISADDFRRATNRQLQKYGIDIEKLSFSNVIINSRNQIQDIYYGSGWSINNSDSANNFIVLNGNYLGNMISNRLTLEDKDGFKQQLDFKSSNDVYRTYINNGQFQMDYRKNGTYSNSPIQIKGGSNNDGSIITDSNYTLNLKTRGLSFFGSTPYGQQNAPATPTDLNSAINSINSLITILKNYGLIK